MKSIVFDIHGSEAEVIEEDFVYCITKPAIGGSMAIGYAVWSKRGTPDGSETLLGEFPQEHHARLFYNALLF